MGTKAQDHGHARRGSNGRGGRRFERGHVPREQLGVVATRGQERRSGGGDRGTANDTGYMVSYWRGKLRSCRGFATLGEAREAAAEHVRDAAKAFTDDPQAMVDESFLAAADWALHAQPEPDRPVGQDLADGTKIRVRLVNGVTARCLASGSDD